VSADPARAGIGGCIGDIGVHAFNLAEYVSGAKVAEFVADLGSGAELKAQAMQGRTRMGTAETGERWINNRFRSAFLLLTRPFGRFGLSARLDLFDTRNRGSDVREEYDDKGWSAMLAAKREWGRFTGLVELLHVSSRREDREEAGLDARQHQTQLQAELRMRW